MFRTDVTPGGIFLGLGARDGDRAATMSSALAALSGLGIEILLASSLYETEPVDLPGDRSLLNGAIEVETALQPLELMSGLLGVERTLGRRRPAASSSSGDHAAASGPLRPADGPRPIDIDLLLYRDEVLGAPSLQVPHPRLHLRRFVLEPLAEIAPGAHHPVLGETVAALLQQCADTAWVRLHAPPSAWWRSEPGRHSRRSPSR